MSRKKSRKRASPPSSSPFWSYLIVVALLAAALVGGGGWWYATRPLVMQQPVIDFEVARGASMRQIAHTVSEAGIELEPTLFTWLARLSGHAVHIKAGSYRVDKAINAWELVTLLSSGANNYGDFPLIEGWTFARVRQSLNAEPDVAHDSLALTDAQLMEKLGMSGVSPEGMFAPDTYSFPRGSADIELLRRAAARMQKILQEEWAGRQADLPLKTPYEALVLASVVEKETGRADDRPLIASVFVNRLRTGMPLQSDPTVIYGMGEKYSGNLHKHDLQTDTPFNSYTRGGLPPTPIAVAGVAALHAVLHPAPTNYLYFVARGDGSSEFSSTLEQHNRAVARYIKASRK